MFGCIVAGRLIQTNLRQIDETHAIFELPNVSSINHICVFLLGTVPFPDGFGATVHFHWPGRGFQLLGALTNDKPSAIFRLRGSFSTTSTLTHAAFQGPSNPSNLSADPGDNTTAILGIAVEPLSSILSSLSSLPSSLTPRPPLTQPPQPLPQPLSLSDPTLLAEKIVKHLFNYLSGFAEGALTPETFVPMGVISRWYESFLAKVRVGGVRFLEGVE